MMTVTIHVTLQFLSITLLFNEFSGVSSTIRCPKPCECLGNAISCENQDIRNIPWKKFPEWVDSVSLRQIRGFRHLSTSAVQSLARLDGLKHLNITSCHEQLVLDGTWLQHLPSLEVLKISHCRLESAPVFDPPHPNLKSLILNRNNIGELRAATFDSLPNLTRLEVNFNRLKELRKDWFRKGHPLQILSANGNEIRRLDAHLNATLTSLRELRLNRNALCRLSSRTFLKSQAAGADGAGALPLSPGLAPRAHSLPLGGGRRIRKRRTKEECGEGGELPAMPSVHTLELSRNRISQVRTLTFKLWTSLKVLRLKRNLLHEDSLMPGAFFIAHGGLTTLDLTANKRLGRVRETWLYVNGRSSMRELILSKCGLRQSLPAKLFHHHSQLRRLHLGGNKLDSLRDGQFSRLDKLEELDLGGNHLVALPAGVFDGLTRLRSLSLADNQLNTLTPQESAFPRPVLTGASPTGLFSPLGQLQTLDLSRNRLTTVQKGDLSGLSSLLTLDLRRNNLTRLAPPGDHCPRLARLLLDSPRLTCDCSAAPLLQWLRRRLPPAARPLVAANCSRPPAFAGKPLLSVHAADLGRCEPRASLEPRVLFLGNTSVSVLRSSNLTLRCEVVVSGIPAAWTPAQRRRLRPQVEWERVEEPSGRRRPILGDPFVPLKPHFRVLQLVALHASRPDTARWLSLLRIRPGSVFGSLGDFQCLAKNEHGHDSSPMVKVNVYQMPRFTDSPAPLISAIAGNTVTIPCSAVGFPPPVSALRKSGGIEFPAARDRRLNIYEGDVHFLIANVQRKDAGDYLCESSNAAGRISEAFTLQVNEIPAFEKPPRAQVEVTAGQSAVLSCRATGWPFPAITWTKDGVPLRLSPPPPANGTTRSPAPRRDLQLTDRGQMLVFERVRPADAAEYGCTLLNVVGRRRTRIVMNVRTPGGRLYPGVRKAGGGGGSGDGGRLSRHLTGIVVIAVVVCVVATSLAWVAALYCFRWRKRAAAAAGGGNPAVARRQLTVGGGNSAVTRRQPLLHASTSWPGPAPNIFVTSRAFEEELVDPATAAAARLLLEKHRLLRRDATRAYDDEEEEEGEGEGEDRGLGAARHPDPAPTSDYNTGTSSECSAHSLSAPAPAHASSSPSLHRPPDTYPCAVSSFGVVHREADEYV